jgi:transposase
MPESPVTINGIRTGSAAAQLSLSRAQLDALVLGLPWQRMGDAGIITMV